MEMSTREENGIVIIELKGKLMGGPDASVLHERLYEYLHDNKNKMVIDLGKVEWMNSSGLGILISILTTIRNHDGDLKVAKITEKVKNLLKVTKLLQVFEMYDSIDDAINSFG